VHSKAAPFGIGEVALVCFSHARYDTERVPQNPFSDSFCVEFSEVRIAPVNTSGRTCRRSGACAYYLSFPVFLILPIGRATPYGGS
jgi:hypothetical protein